MRWEMKWDLKKNKKTEYVGMQREYAEVIAGAWVIAVGTSK